MSVPAEATTADSPPPRRRIPAVAVLLGFFNPVVCMCYVGRPLRAVGYVALWVVVTTGIFLLARRGWWPAGISWIPPLLAISVLCMLDGYRIAERHEKGFTGPWYTTWPGLVAIGVAFAVVVILFRAFLFEPFRQPSASMLPTLVEDDQFFVSKSAYRSATPERGDIVVFRVPQTNVNYVKRVVGLPGDVVEYDGDARRLVINGAPASLELIGAYDADPVYRLGRERLDDVEHAVLHMPRLQSAGGTFRVPDGHFFLLGDNRDNSQDSRFQSVGYIPAENIIGKVFFIWWNTDIPTRAGIVPE
jgi:signal peptidase I